MVKVEVGGGVGVLAGVHIDGERIRQGVSQILILVKGRDSGSTNSVVTASGVFLGGIMVVRY